MTTSFHIRPGEERDLRFLAAIEQAAEKLFPAERIPDVGRVFPERLMQQAQTSNLLFVAEDHGFASAMASDGSPRSHGGGVVGFAVCAVAGPFLHLCELAVHPHVGRRGIGRALVERVLVEGRERKHRGVTLTTFADFPWNARFYESLGFTMLNDDALTPMLRSTLHAEAEAGLTERVAMRHDLTLTSSE